MLFKGKWHKTLNFYDLNSLESFKEWVKENLSLYSDEREPSEDELRKLLEYVKNKSEEQKVDQKIKWFDKLDGLVERVVSLKNKRKAKTE
tara:strand:+ start:173 stop:442 length:270 start_codon:yes stop_codon:yes gene_type:complete